MRIFYIVMIILAFFELMSVRFAMSKIARAYEIWADSMAADEGGSDEKSE